MCILLDFFEIDLKDNQLCCFNFHYDKYISVFISFLFYFYITPFQSFLNTFALELFYSFRLLTRAQIYCCPLNSRTNTIRVWRAIFSKITSSAHWYWSIMKNQKTSLPVKTKLCSSLQNICLHLHLGFQYKFSASWSSWLSLSSSWQIHKYLFNSVLSYWIVKVCVNHTESESICSCYINLNRGIALSQFFSKFHTI